MRVIDASVVVAALLDSGPTGRWAESVLEGGPLAAPHHMPLEVAGILRRATLSGDLDGAAAHEAHDDLLRLPVELVEYGPVAARAWALRHTVSLYDGWYVALAERLDAPLATLDRHLTRAPGPACSFLVPEERG
jgi:predicted nucleic acid-binding protein